MPTRRKSPLATYEKLSPNCTKPRTGKIRRLTPHCVAGTLSAEGIVGLSNFQVADSTNGSSTNYAIGTDGKIALGVEETNRAWTSSSKVNDHEAITFELSNTGKGPDWPMSDATINAWLDLATEIAAFYGYKKVSYYGTPDAYGTDDEMIITLHCWYKNKTCPGPYFTRQIPKLVNEINNRLKGLTPVAFVGEGTPTAQDTSTNTTASIGNDTNFLVKITTSALNVRKGPGTSYAVVKTLINDPNTYTIVEQSGTWGKLKSGLGWISLNYTKRV